MTPTLSRSCRSWLAALSLGLSVFTTTAIANDHGGGSPGGEPIKLMVNLGNPGTDGKFLVFEVSLEAPPEVAQAVAVHRPQVMHNLLLMLSDEKASHLLTLQGKHDLAEKIIAEVNKTIHESGKTGVHEVLFTSFIIQ